MKIYRVNMTTKEVTAEEVPEKYAALGGRGLTSQIIADEVTPTCNPIGPNNKLAIAPGLLSGTRAPSSGRLSVGAKSPLTGGIKESNAGGTAARKLAKMNIKAIVIDDADAPGIDYADEDKFKSAARDFTKMLLDHPVCGEGLPEYGTAVLVNILNEAGGLPTKNFSSGRFEEAEEISGETMAELIEERGGTTAHPCHPGCVMRCSQIYNDEEGEYLTGGFEYETIWGFGANSEVDDLDAIAQMDRLCDDIGLDTIEMGAAVGVAMEAGIIEFGDAEGVIELLKEVGEGTPLGRIIGSGAGFTGKTFGVTRVPVVKNQGIPAYDPRTVKGVGVTYATSPMGADHTAGYAVTANILDVGGSVDPLSTEGQVELSRDLQIATAAVDSTGLCIFTAFAILDVEEGLPKVVEMLNTQYGLELTVDDVPELGKSVLKAEREFNRKAGFTSTDDRLPDFFDEEECPPHNIKFDITPEELDEVYNF